MSTYATELRTLRAAYERGWRQVGTPRWQRYYALSAVVHELAFAIAISVDLGLPVDADELRLFRQAEERLERAYAERTESRSSTLVVIQDVYLP